jgi:hypothetical protein
MISVENLSDFAEKLGNAEGYCSGEDEIVPNEISHTEDEQIERQVGPLVAVEERLAVGDLRKISEANCIGEHNPPKRISQWTDDGFFGKRER